MNPAGSEAGEAVVIAFRDAAEFEAWLDAHAGLRAGVWLKIAKKGSGILSGAALGDSQKRHDDQRSDGDGDARNGVAGPGLTDQVLDAADRAGCWSPSLPRRAGRHVAPGDERKCQREDS
jgi:hypothetical protein